MTAITKLPEEVLLMIFELLELDDIQNCHRVCRAWYSPAHVKLLKKVRFTKVSTILHFIESVDRNPDPLYLKAVKSIYICDLDKDDIYIDHVADRSDENSPTFKFGKDNLKKLFFRFPNLEQVKFFDSLNIIDEFDDEIRHQFPQIDSFEVDVSDQSLTRYYNSLKSVRHLVTSLNIDPKKARASIDNEQGGPISFICQFPRLQKINSGLCLTFLRWLLILEKLPNLTIIRTFASLDDLESFAEMHLADKRPDEKAQLVERLSKIHSLSYVSLNQFQLNSTKFITKYLTGLRKLYICSVLPRIWTDSHQLLYCNVVSDLAHSIDDCTVKLSLAQPELQEYLPIIANKVFQQTAKSTDAPYRCLRINVDTSNPFGLNIVSNQRERRIDINYNQIHKLKDIVNKIFKSDIQLNDVDEFNLNINFEYYHSAKMELYNTFLKALPTLKKISLSLPEDFTDSINVRVGGAPRLPLLEEITLRAPTEVPCQQLLDQFYWTSQRIKRFNFYNFTGIWKESIGEFQIELGQLTLETLVLDVASVISKTTCGLEDDAEEFFVIETEFIGDSEARQLHKVDIDLESITKIEDKDLRGLIRGETYVRVHILVKDLKNLQLVNLNCCYTDITDLTKFERIKLSYE